MALNGMDRKLLLAAELGRLDMVRELIASGARVEAVAFFDRRPLHLAAGAGQVAVVEYLLEKGAEIDAADNDGWQPLHHAVEAEKAAVVEVLLDAGADPAARAKAGITPLELADDSPEILALLKKWMAPDFLEKRRQAENVKAIREHWKRMGRFTPSCPRI